MHMTITVADVTVDQALKVLSALEFANLIGRDTATSAVTVGMTAPDAVAVADAYVRSLPQTRKTLLPEAPQTETPSVPLRNAADCDLYVEDVAGYHLQSVLDAWIQDRGTKRRLTCPLPVIGSTARENRVSIAEAQAMLGWGRTTIYPFINSSTIEFIEVKHGRRARYFMTPEQVAVLRLAKVIAEATGRTRVGAPCLRQATRAFLAVYP